jgi:hypothetical protein
MAKGFATMSLLRDHQGYHGRLQASMVGKTRGVKRVRRWGQAKLIFQALNLEKSLGFAAMRYSRSQGWRWTTSGLAFGARYRRR